MNDMENQCSQADTAAVQAQAPAVPSSVATKDEIALADYFAVVSKYRRMIFTTCFVVVFLTGLVSLLLPRTYAATASVVPPMDMLRREAGFGAGLGIGLTPSLREAVGVSSIAELYTGLLRSRVVADAIIDRFDLMNVYKVEKRSITRVMLHDNTDVRFSKDSILRITVTDRDPQRAADIANAFVEELNRENRRLSVSQATSKRIFLENRLREIEGKLSKIDSILSGDAKIQEMLYELLTKECEIAKIEEAKDMPTIQVLDKAIAPETRMPLGAKRKVLIAGVGSFTFAVFLAFLLESLGKSGLKWMEPGLKLRGCLSR